MRKLGLVTGYLGGYSKDPTYFPHEYAFAQCCKKNGVELYYVSPYWYDRSQGVFVEYVYITRDGFYRIYDSIVPDILWLRTNHALPYVCDVFGGSNSVVVPTPRLKHIENDKWSVFLYLCKYQPQTVLLSQYISGYNDDERDGEARVVKPRTGTGGHGIEFLSHREISKKIRQGRLHGQHNNYVVQQKKDFAGGFSSKYAGNHDVRLIYAGLEYIANYVRQPEKGSLKSNISQGGNQFCLEKTQLPQELFVLAKCIQNALSISNHDVYSLDFAFCSLDKQRRLIEINGSPGVRFPQKDIGYRDDFFEKLLSYFISL